MIRKYLDIIFVIALIQVQVEHVVSCNSSSKEVLYQPQQVEIKNFPYLVSIRKWNAHICTGSILASKYVLTSAKCLCFDDDRDNSAITVITGVTDIHETGNKFSVKDVKCHDTTVNHFLTRGNYDNVAVIELEDEIRFDSQTVAEASLSFTPIPESTECFFVGWNRVAKSDSQKSILHKLQVNTITGGECQKLEKKSTTSRHNNNLACAVKELKSEAGSNTFYTPAYSWQPEGSPLICNNNIVGLFDFERPVSNHRAPTVITVAQIAPDSTKLFIERFKHN